MFCINKKKGQKLSDRGVALRLKIIGLLTEDDFNYIRSSDIVSLDLSEAELEKSFMESGSSPLSEYYNLESVILPNAFKNIRDWEFYRCKSLSSINLPDDVTDIGCCAFSQCKSLASINLPSTVTNICQSAFYDCSSLSTINIPEKITKIDWCTFCSCSSLAFINIPNGVLEIGGNAFGDCSSLAALHMPGSLVDIKTYAFYNCSSLTSVRFPRGIKNIGAYAFYGCSSLIFIEISATVLVVGDSAFSKCSSLKLANILDKNKYAENRDEVRFGTEPLQQNNNNGDLPLIFNETVFEIAEYTMYGGNVFRGLGRIKNDNPGKKYPKEKEKFKYNFISSPGILRCWYF